MSASESEYSHSIVDEAPPAKQLKKKVTKRKAPDVRGTNTSNRTSKPSESKASKNNNEKKRSSDLFGLEEDVERPITSCSDLGSSLVSRVDNGKVRRKLDLSGEFYVDIKVYAKGDVVSIPREDRWRKALVALKLQLDRGSVQWNALQKFMQRAHELFNDAEPTYYSDNIHFK